MRMPFALAASVAALALLANAPAQAQGAQQTVQLAKVDVVKTATGYRASKVIGATVVNEANDSVGKVDDVIIGTDQKPYVVLSVGGFPTATSAKADLSGIAEKSGIRFATTARTIEEFMRAWREARARKELSFIVAKVDAVGPKTFLMDLPLLENRFQFQRWLKQPGH